MDRNRALSCPSFLLVSQPFSVEFGWLMILLMSSLLYISILTLILGGQFHEFVDLRVRYRAADFVQVAIFRLLWLAECCDKEFGEVDQMCKSASAPGLLMTRRV